MRIVVAALTVAPLLGLGATGCKKKKSETIVTRPVVAPESAPPAPAPPPPAMTPAEIIQKMETLEDAIALAKPAMADTESAVSIGAVLLGAWSIDKLSWNALNALPKTEHKLVMKDPDEERGKVLCTRGQL
ncbi:MAG: hypothetical protein KIT72_16570 [Polyangiaceae bacterium]|nr:hypothetical protein [Polyangiaceae bacterium]